MSEWCGKCESSPTRSKGWEGLDLVKETDRGDGADHTHESNKKHRFRAE